jgi:hypothetical protein
LLFSKLVYRGIERVKVLGACRRGGVFRIGHKFGAPMACAQRSQIRPPVVAILM